MAFTRTAASAALTCLVLGLALPAQAQSDEDLQKKLANPVAELITVPVQLTTNVDTGNSHKPQHALNIQPVYPVRFSSVKLINRLVVPLLSNPARAPGQDRENGLGDITYEGFFTALEPGRVIWAAGPILQMRTASNDLLGSGKWSAGPAVLVLAQPGRWSAGALVTQLWSFAGDDSRRDVNQTQIQPIVSYRLSPRHTIGYTGTITANWSEDRSSQRWTVPLGLTYSTLVKTAGGSAINYVAGAGYNVVRPDAAARWFARFQMTFIFDK